MKSITCNHLIAGHRVNEIHIVSPETALVVPLKDQSRSMEDLLATSA